MRYRDLNAPPDRSMREIVKGLKGHAETGNTGAHGTKHMGMTGDQLWYRPDGREISVREVDEALVAAQDRIDEAATDLEGTQIRLEQAEQDVATVSGDLDRVETVVIPGAVADLEAADAAAQEQFVQLDSRLDTFGDDEALAGMRQALSDAQATATSAQEAASAADKAASAASQAALEAAGVAASKGRVIIQDTEPTGDDRQAANIWIKPAVDDPDTEITETATTYVYLADTDTWMPTTSDELAQAAQNALDAREAAQQAQQRADTAISNAATAQSAAEAAQRTADQATTDAREAHNEAVAAQAAADAIRSDLATGPSLWADPSFERSRGGLPGPGADDLYPGRIDRSQDWAATGEWSVKYTANGSGGNNYGSYGFGSLTPGNWYAVSATVHAGEHAQQWNTTWDIRDLPQQTGGTVVEYVISGTDGRFDLEPFETKTKTWFFQATEEGRAFRFWAGQTAAYNRAEHVGQVVYLDDFRLVDVTDSYPQYLAAQAAAKAAQDRADEAYTEAESKLDESQVDAKITASANGKNSITISTSAPSGDGVVSGDVWWRRDGDYNIFGQWVWTGSAWGARQIRSEVIANLDVHKLQVTGEAKMDSAVIDKLFTETFVAHKITGSELSIASVKSDGSLAPDSVSAVTIKDGAITTPKLKVTGDMSAAIVKAMTTNTKKLVVTESAVLNHVTAIGKTVVDDINVQGKLIGSNGVFTGTVDFANVNVTGQAIVNKLGANSISADKISGGSFAGKIFEGGSFRGGEFQAPASPRWNGGIAISAAGGIQGWDYESNPSNPDKILQLGSSSYPNFVAGSMSTSPVGKPGAILTPVKGGGGQVGGGVWFSEDGSLGNDQAAIYSYLDGNIHIRPKDTVPRGTVFIDGNLIVRERTTFDNAVDVGSLISSGSVVVGRSGNRKAVTVHGTLRATHPGSGSGSANARYESNGQLVLVSSSRRYKKNIADWNPEAERVLALQPRQWQHDDPDNPPEIGIDERWHVGFIAEEVSDLGLRGLVEYAGDGAGGWRPEALRYDRFAAAHQIVLQKHEDEIKELRERIALLESK